MLYHKRRVTTIAGNRTRSDLRPSPVSQLQAWLDSPLSSKRRSSCTGGGAAPTGKERWLSAGYMPGDSATEYFVGDDSPSTQRGHRGELLAVCRNSRAATPVASQSATFSQRARHAEQRLPKQGKPAVQKCPRWISALTQKQRRAQPEGVGRRR